MVEVIVIRGARHEVHDCITCGVVYTIPEVMISQQRKHGGYHSCPSGHRQGWDKDGCQFAKLERERDRLKQQIAERDDAIAEQKRMREAVERQAAVAKGQVTQLKKRAAAGLCPCCNRHFTNLERHIASKHKDEAVIQ